MRMKHLAQKNKMTKGMNAVTSWVPSVFTQKDLNKARADGLVSDEDQVIFPSTERIPKPRDGFRVMFFAFLLRGLSLPAHEFLRGLLFIYGVQLHQLIPNSILHIACFITLLRVVSGDRSKLSSLEIPLSTLPQCRIIKETQTGWSLYFCPC
jgi:hypothetical protein